MALHAAEEESIEAIKKWWSDNGTFVVVVVAATALLWGGWTFWQSSSQASTAAASDLYEEILALASTEPGVAVTESERTQIIAAAADLQANHSDSVYALYGALFAAQQAVNGADLDVAEQQLRWVLDNAQTGLFGNADDGLILTAQLRLGRVLLGKGEPEQALTLVEGLDPGTFEADFAELRGDIYLSQGRLVDARDAYTTALQTGTGANTFLQMKLDELGSES
ncbi:MAG: tetratricopeptide repeat protein [Gammaproteobacteria bacterium]|nr:tetratricopeptide repeat protein [Gammaproteobacteria bacterium]